MNFQLDELPSSDEAAGGVYHFVVFSHFPCVVCVSTRCSVGRAVFDGFCVVFYIRKDVV